MQLVHILNVLSLNTLPLLYFLNITSSVSTSQTQTGSLHFHSAGLQCDKLRLDKDFLLQTATENPKKELFSPFLFSWTLPHSFSGCCHHLSSFLNFHVFTQSTQLAPKASCPAWPLPSLSTVVLIPFLVGSYILSEGTLEKISHFMKCSFCFLSSCSIFCLLKECGGLWFAFNKLFSCNKLTSYFFGLNTLTL